MSRGQKAAAADEVPVLLAAPVTVGRFEVRAWNLRQFISVYPLLRRLIDRLIGQGLTLDNLETFVGERLLDCLPELLPDLPPLLAATLDIPLEEAGDLDLVTVTRLVLAIFSQNLEPLKNLSSLVPAPLAGVGTSTP